MSYKLSCIAIDDEPVALKIIQSLIEKTDRLNLLGTFQDPEEGLNFLVKNEPDILFLDIQMPNLSGMDILGSLAKKPQIIMVTSNSKYAAEAFDFQVTDFLLKPIKSYARFMQAVQLAVDNIDKTWLATTSYQKGIYLKIDSELTNISFDEMRFIEAYGDYIKVHTPERVHVVYCKLSSIEQKLPIRQFIRVHRSFLVNAEHIEKVSNKDVVINGQAVPVSPKYKKELFACISTL